MPASKPSKHSKHSKPSTHPKPLFQYPVSRVSIPVLNMYLSQTYSSDDCDENESLKIIMNSIRRCIRLMLKRLCGREEKSNMSLVSVKMTENRAAPIQPTTRTRQHQSNAA
jgi:hypothetical protein